MKQCHNCGNPLPDKSTFCRKCGRAQYGVEPRGVNRELGWPATVGIFLLGFSILALIFFVAFFDTTVQSGEGRVHNIGLMQDRMIGLFVAFAGLVGAILLIVFGLKAQSKK